jgi:DNA-binding Lrp family transcriptional regulator
MELKKEEIRILNELRKNSRMKFNELGKRLNMPLNRLITKFKAVENKAVKRYATLVNFNKLDYFVTVFMAIMPKYDNDLKKFLMCHSNVNSLYRINNGYTLFAELVFRDIKSLHDFIDEVNKYMVEKMQVYYLIEEIAKEKFSNFENES